MTIKQPTKIEAQAYLDTQAKCGLNIGDIVKITRAAETHENGWNNSWVLDMDLEVGQIRTISLIAEYGVRFKECGYTYPFFVLESVKKIKECKIDD